MLWFHRCLFIVVSPIVCVGGGGGVSVGSLFCIFVSFLVLQSFCWERELVALLLLVSECHVRYRSLTLPCGVLGWSFW